MDIGKTFATDPKLEAEGVWQDIGDGARLLVARKGNRRFKDTLRRLTRGKERAISLGVYPEDAAAELMAEAMAEGLLLGWEGIEDQGKAIPYSREAAADLMTRYKDFRELVDSLSDDLESYRVTATEDAEKNSRKSSPSA